MAYINIVRRWLMSMEYIDVDQLLARREECRNAKLPPLNSRMNMARRLRERVAPSQLLGARNRALDRRMMSRVRLKPIARDDLNFD